MKLKKLFKGLGKKVTPATKMVALERWEQIHKHGFDANNDKFYVNGEIIQAALFCIAPTDPNNHWPPNWSNQFKESILKKGKIERVAVAAALLTAEVDRMMVSYHKYVK